MKIKPNYNSRSEKKEWEKRLEAIRAIRDKYVDISPLPISEKKLLLGVLTDATDLERILHYFRQQGCYEKFARDKDKIYYFWKLNLKIINRSLYAVDEINKIYSGEILVCNDLRLDKKIGIVFYKNKRADFKPDTDEYKLLKVLMENPNKRVSTEEINKALGKNEPTKKDNRDIGFIIRNIKNKLKIGTKNKKGYKNLFEPCNGYRIIC